MIITPSLIESADTNDENVILNTLNPDKLISSLPYKESFSSELSKIEADDFLVGFTESNCLSLILVESSHCNSLLMKG